MDTIVGSILPTYVDNGLLYHIYDSVLVVMPYIL